MPRSTHNGRFCMPKFMKIILTIIVVLIGLSFIFMLVMRQIIGKDLAKMEKGLGKENVEALLKMNEIMESSPHYEKCRQADLDACMEIGHELSAQEKYHQARMFFLLFCDKDQSYMNACYFAAKINFQKFGNIEKSLEEFRTLCDKKHQLSCLYAGSIYSVVKNDMEKAIDYYRKGCDLNDARSCVNMYKEFVEKDGPKINNDRAAEMLSYFLKGLTFYLDECHSQRKASSCFEAAKLIQSRNASSDKKLSIYHQELMENACQLGERNACALLQNGNK